MLTGRGRGGSHEVCGQTRADKMRSKMNVQRCTKIASEACKEISVEMLVTVQQRFLQRHEVKVCSSTCLCKVYVVFRVRLLSHTC